MSRALVIEQTLTPEVMSILEDFSISDARFLNAQDCHKKLAKLFRKKAHAFNLVILNRSQVPQKIRQQLIEFATKSGIDFLEFGRPLARPSAVRLTRRDV